jgi:hypothetical protein
MPYTPRYGADLGFAYPLSARTREAFGDGGINFSPGFGASFERKGLLIMPDFNLYSAQKKVMGESNRAFIALVGPSFRFGFVDPFTTQIGEDGEAKVRFRTFAPYAQFTLGVGYADVSVRSADEEEKGLTYGVSFALGTSISRSAYVETRLRLMPKIASYDFSTIGISFGMRF